MQPVTVLAPNGTRLETNVSAEAVYYFNRWQAGIDEECPDHVMDEIERVLDMLGSCE